MDPFLLVTLGSLQPGLWIKVQAAPVSVQDRCKTVRRLIFYRAVCFYNRLRTFLRQQGQVSPGGYLTSATGTPPHMSVKAFLLVLQYLEICLYFVEALFHVLEP